MTCHTEAQAEESLTSQKPSFRGVSRRISCKPKKRHSEAQAEESHVRLARDLSLSLKMTERCVIQSRRRRISDKPNSRPVRDPSG